jgi:hypothetical protein
MPLAPDWFAPAVNSAFPCAPSNAGGVPLEVTETVRTAVKAVLVWFLIA